MQARPARAIVALVSLAVVIAGCGGTRGRRAAPVAQRSAATAVDADDAVRATADLGDAARAMAQRLGRGAPTWPPLSTTRPCGDDGASPGDRDDVRRTATLVACLARSDIPRPRRADGAPFRVVSLARQARSLQTAIRLAPAYGTLGVYVSADGRAFAVVARRRAVPDQVVDYDAAWCCGGG